MIPYCFNLYLVTKQISSSKLQQFAPSKHLQLGVKFPNIIDRFCLRMRVNRSIISPSRYLNSISTISRKFPRSLSSMLVIGICIDFILLIMSLGKFPLSLSIFHCFVSVIQSTYSHLYINKIFHIRIDFQ